MTCNVSSDRSWLLIEVGAVYFHLLPCILWTGISHSFDPWETFQVDEFLPFLPVITGLRTAGMRDRHWDLLSEKLGVDLHPDDSYTLTM